MEFTCVICLKKFKPRWFSQVACGGKCLHAVQYRADRGTPIERPWGEQTGLWLSNKRACKTCGKEIPIMREVNSLYCSVDCQKNRWRPYRAGRYPLSAEQREHKRQLDRRYDARKRAIVRAALELGLIKEI